MAKYLLLLRDTGTYPDMSPEAMQAVLQRYIDWTKGLATRGVLVDASKLYDGTGRVMRDRRGSRPSPTARMSRARRSSAGTTSSRPPRTTKPSPCRRTARIWTSGSIEIRELEAMGDGQS